MRQPAPPRRRLAAFGLDYLVIVAYAIVLFLVTRLMVGPLEVPESFGWRVDLLAFGTLVLPVILYFSLSEASRSGGTWGKRQVGICVVSREGTRISVPQSLMRSSAKFAPWQIAHTCLFHIPGWPLHPDAASKWMLGTYGAVGLAVISLLSLFLSRGHRTVYDLVAGTSVIDLPPTSDPRIVRGPRGGV